MTRSQAALQARYNLKEVKIRITRNVELEKMQLLTAPPPAKKMRRASVAVEHFEQVPVEPMQMEPIEQNEMIGEVAQQAPNENLNVQEPVYRNVDEAIANPFRFIDQRIDEMLQNLHPLHFEEHWDVNFFLADAEVTDDVGDGDHTNQRPSPKDAPPVRNLNDGFEDESLFYDPLMHAHNDNERAEDEDIGLNLLDANEVFQNINDD